MKKYFFLILSSLIFAITSCQKENAVESVESDTGNSTPSTRATVPSFRVHVSPDGTVNYSWYYPLGLDGGLPELYYITIESTSYGVIFTTTVNAHSGSGSGTLNGNYVMDYMGVVKASVMVGGPGLVNTITLDYSSSGFLGIYPEPCNHDFSLYDLQGFENMYYNYGAIMGLPEIHEPYRIMFECIFSNPGKDTTYEYVSALIYPDGEQLVIWPPIPLSEFRGVVKVYSLQCDKALSTDVNIPCDNYFYADFTLLSGVLTVGTFSEHLSE